jgi:5'-nucleotidase (lipoprotein e(P4) family)
MAMRSLLLMVLFATACAPTATVSTPVPQASASVPLAVHWYRTAAEQEAVYVQTYRAATARMEDLSRGRAAGTWAVILDADETVLDNSTYQKERAEQGLGFTSESWDAWVLRVEASALPGAAAFIARARQLGGVVVLVTNRDDHVCDPTRENLVRLGIAVDAVLCRAGGVSDKNPRFRAVAEGAIPGLAPAEVLLWLGDNIQDFPGLSQQLRGQGEATFALFGDRYFILPNPMYGSFERNPAR